MVINLAASLIEFLNRKIFRHFFYCDTFGAGILLGFSFSMVSSCIATEPSMVFWDVYKQGFMAGSLELFFFQEHISYIKSGTP